MAPRHAAEPRPIWAVCSGLVTCAGSLPGIPLWPLRMGDAHPGTRLGETVRDACQLGRQPSGDETSAESDRVPRRSHARARDRDRDVHHQATARHRPICSVGSLLASGPPPATQLGGSAPPPQCVYGRPGQRTENQYRNEDAWVRGNGVGVVVPQVCGALKPGYGQLDPHGEGQAQSACPHDGASHWPPTARDQTVDHQ